MLNTHFYRHLPLLLSTVLLICLSVAARPALALVNTTTSLAAAPSAATVFGQTVTFTATVVTNPGGVPVGNNGTDTVTIKDTTTGTTLGSGAPNASGKFAAAVSNLAVTAGDMIQASFADTSAAFGASSDTVTQAVGKADTTTTFGASPNSSPFQQSGTLTATVAAVAPGAGTPTGSVTFSVDGANQIVPVSGGVATLSTANLAVGSHTITASYVGSADYNPSTTSAPFALTVTRASTSTAVTGPAASTLGSSVTFTATVTVTSGAGTPTAPTGSVTFTDSVSGTLNTVGLVDNAGTFTAQISTSTLGSGPHTISATYNGDGNFSTSASTANAIITVSKAVTMTALTAPASSIYGQSVTLSVAVTGPGGTPTGTVTFKDGSTPLTTVGLAGGTASFSISTLIGGSHSLTAVYNGDGNYNTSTSTPALSLVVSRAGSSPSLMSSPGTSVFGQPVTFTATISGVTGAATPTGTVTFTDSYLDAANVPHSQTLGTATLVNGSIGLQTTALPAAGHTITATYNGDVNYNPSATNGPQTVTPAATTTAVVSSQNPSVINTAVAFTATVTTQAPGGGTPAGTLAFTITPPSGGTPVTVTGVAGGTTSNSALFSGSYTFTAAGVYTVTAAFTPRTDATSGTVNFSGSSASLQPSQQVASAIPAVTLASDTPTSVFGQAVTFTTTVTGTGSVTPTGSITFQSDGVTIGTASLAAGTSPQATASLTTTVLPAATHQISAVYSGDANYGTTAKSIPQQVDTAATAAVVQSSKPVSNFGDAVTFTVQVSAVAPGSGKPTGLIQFKDGGANLGSPVLLDATSQAGITVSSLTTGPHIITAVYGGDSNFSPVTGGLTDGNGQPIQQQVQLAPPGSLNLTSNSPVTGTVPTSVFGQPVTFTATVVGNNNIVPTGSITFTDGMNVLATIAMSGGQASFTTPATTLTAGPHTIAAAYSGDTHYGPTSNSLVQAVTADATATSASVAPSPANTGDPVTYTITVTNATGTGVPPAGTVTLTDSFDGTHPPAKATVTLQPNTADRSGNTSSAQATIRFSQPSTPTVPHIVTLIYGPAGGNFSPSSVALPITVFNQPAADITFDQPFLLVPGTTKYTNNGLTTAQLLRATDPQTLGINVQKLVASPVPSVYFNGTLLPGVVVDTDADGNPHLTVQIPATLTATAGRATVQVVNENTNTSTGIPSAEIAINPPMAIPTYPLTAARNLRMFSLPYDYSSFSPYDILQGIALITPATGSGAQSPVVTTNGAGGFQYDPLNDLLSAAPLRFTTTATDPGFLALYHWNPGQLRYLTTVPAAGQAADNVPFALGQAFWAVGGPQASFLGVLQLGAPAAFSPTGIPLQAGWNMIGDPFPTPVDLSSLQVSYQGAGLSFYSTAQQSDSAVSRGIVSPILWSYEQAADGTAAYQINYGGLTPLAGHNALRPYEGYWLYSYQACTLLISNTQPAP